MDIMSRINSQPNQFKGARKCRICGISWLLFAFNNNLVPSIFSGIIESMNTIVIFIAKPLKIKRDMKQEKESLWGKQTSRK